MFVQGNVRATRCHRGLNRGDSTCGQRLMAKRVVFVGEDLFFHVDLMNDFRCFVFSEHL